MIQSMTGYGKATAELPTKKVTIEMKSLNSKQIDLSVRMPNIYREHEMNLRNLIGREFSRGKVDVSIYVENIGAESNNVINQNVLQAYYKQIKESAELLNVELPQDWFTVLLRMPDVMKYEIAEADEQEWETVMTAIEEAIVHIKKFRDQEGEMLYNLFIEKIENIRALLAEIEPYEEERINTVKEKILESLKKIGDFDYDKNRFEQEMIYHIERLDINEEKSRLTNHLNYFIETMDNEVAQGKKLNFIAQEIGREINTMGSKSNHAEMQKIVVKMKDELEQIKEQVLNVL